MKRYPISLALPFAAGFASLFMSAVLLNSCDTFDSEITEPKVSISNDELYVLAGGETIIDLTSLVSANFSGSLSVTEQPIRGTLQNIGGGLLRYTPNHGSGRTRDSFEFTAFTNTNSVLSKDTVFINIETDSTDLPCDIFPMPDYVTGFEQSSGTRINVLSNDRLCGKSVTTEIYRGTPHPLPAHGTAEVSGASVIYTPGPSFTGKDTLIYKVVDVHQPSSFGYGFVYINRDSTCSFQLRDDAYPLKTQGEADFYLDVFANDMLCDSIDTYTVSIPTQPKHGQLTFTGRAFNYHATQQGNVTDDFIYTLKSGSRQESAHVTLTISTLDNPCVFQAIADTVDISALSTSTVYIDVLGNDQVCDSLKNMSIALQPKYGSASIDNSTKKIVYSRIVLKSDSLQYQIYNGSVWRRATLYIKQQE